MDKEVLKLFAALTMIFVLWVPQETQAKTFLGAAVADAPDTGKERSTLTTRVKISLPADTASAAAYAPNHLIYDGDYRGAKELISKLIELSEAAGADSKYIVHLEQGRVAIESAMKNRKDSAALLENAFPGLYRADVLGEDESESVYQQAVRRMRAEGVRPGEMAVRRKPAGRGQGLEIVKVTRLEEQSRGRTSAFDEDTLVIKQGRTSITIQRYRNQFVQSIVSPHDSRLLQMFSIPIPQVLSAGTARVHFSDGSSLPIDIGAGVLPPEIFPCIPRPPRPVKSYFPRYSGRRCRTRVYFRIRRAPPI